MAKTKIVVVSLKEIVRTALFVIAALAFILLLIYLFIPKDKESAELQGDKYIEGVYTSNIMLDDNSVAIHVTVDENSILSVEVDPIDETVAVFYPLLEPTVESVSSQIMSNQSTEVTATIDNLYTSRVIIEAVDRALAEASVLSSEN